MGPNYDVAAAIRKNVCSIRYATDARNPNYTPTYSKDRLNCNNPTSLTANSGRSAVKSIGNLTDNGLVNEVQCYMQFQWIFMTSECQKWTKIAFFDQIRFIGLG